MGLAVALSAAAIAVAVGAGAASAANPLVVAVTSPGTSTPPNSLGGYSMRSLPTTDPSHNQFDTVCGLDVISWVGCASLRYIGSGWATWSHGYTGSVYFCTIINCPGDIMTINLPFNTNAFSFDVESNNFNPTAPATAFTFIVDASGSNAPGITTAVTVAPNGTSNARYVGFYSKAPSRSNLIQALKIQCLGNCNGFAIGEFKINQARLTQP
ncbi:MAG TPA: hypothetical protein VHS03_12070 [Gaiellaceae bacterium]|nr:hypothetical protein [Gaiellaceae bacterium]